MVRPLSQGDRERYLRMAADFYASPAVLHCVPEEYLTRAFDEMMLRDTYMCGYILERDGVSCGYGVVSKTYSQEAGGMVWWLEELYILPEFRGMGCGSEFFAYIDAVRGDTARLRLETEPDNLRAKELYRRLGFTELPYQQMVRELPQK